MKFLRVDTMKPLRIDTNRLRLLNKSMWGCACSVCDKLQSKWEMEVTTENASKPGQVEPTEAIQICSMCFLYESKWGQNRAVDLREYLREVLASDPDRKIILSPEEKLTNIDDADFILGCIVLTSRKFDIEDSGKGVEDLAHGVV